MRPAYTKIKLLWFLISLFLLFACTTRSPLEPKPTNYLYIIAINALETNTDIVATSYTTIVEDTTIVVYYEVLDEVSVQIKAIQFQYLEVWYTYSFEHIYIKILFLAESALLEYLDTVPVSHLVRALQQVGLLPTIADF